MNNQISSLKELKAEIARVSELKKEKEQNIVQKVHHLSEQLKPSNIVKNFLQSFTKSDDVKNQLTSIGTEATIGYLLSNILFKNASPIIRKMTTVIGTAIISNILGDDTAKYIEKFKKIYHKLTKKDTNPPESTFNEEDIYKSEE